MPEQTIRDEAIATLKKLEAKDPGLKQFLKNAHAYAVFPAVGKAAVVVGGALGRGAVFEKGRFVGYATLSQMTIGVQIGGDTFAELVVFESPEAFERFKKGKTAFSANASAVLVKAGKAGTKDFEKGVAALAYTKGGMLLELSIGGQRFKFKDAGEGESGKESGKKSGAGAAKGRGHEQEESEQEEGEDQGQESGGMISRATGGIRSAASSIGGFVKEHPVASTVVGVGVLGAALLATRALRGAGAASGEGDEGSEGDEDEGGAENQADGGEEDDESGEEDQQDEGDKDQEESGHDMLSFLRRRRTKA